jgi:hypothetical protein
MLGNTFLAKGDTERVSEIGIQMMEIAKESGDNLQISNALMLTARNFSLQGKFREGIEQIKQNLSILGESGFLFGQALPYLLLVIWSFNEGDLESTDRYLKKLGGIANQQGEILDTMFHFAKAYTLRLSDRRQDRIEAEYLFRSVIEKGSPELILQTIPRLCTLLLSEFKRYEDNEILEDVNKYINDLMQYAEEQRSYMYLTWSFLLQAKMKLIGNNFDEARRLLSQAQQNAEWHGLSYLAQNVSKEHDELLKKEDNWKDMIRNDAPISERIEMANIDVVMDQISDVKLLNPAKMEIEQPVLLSVLNKDGKMILSNSFSADTAIDKMVISNFISASNRMFSDSLDRARFGDYTILMGTVNQFSVCYVFNGQSYSAGQKLTNFTEALKESRVIMDLLSDSKSTNGMITIADKPDLEELIVESFVSDPKKFQLPFKAYKGDKSFLFISYSHSDKLQVFPIIDYLNKSGFNIWYDEGISVSEDWKKSIVNNLNRCAGFVVFITPHIIDSMYVRREISFALDKNKKFFAIYLKDTQLPDDLAFEISGIQSMKKYVMQEDEFYKKMIEVLKPVLD